jgi:hypothetical protein
MPEYAVFSRRLLTGTISDLSPATRIAWIAVLFEAEKLRGRVKLPVRDLAKLASITTAEAAEALRAFQEPDPFSSSKEFDGRRLIPVEGEEDWFVLTTWEKHVEERQAFFARLRKQRQRSKSRDVTASHDESRSVTKELEPEPELELNPKTKTKSLSPAAQKMTAKERVEGFTLDAKHYTWARRVCPSVDLEAELEAWKDRERANGYTTGKAPGKPVQDAQAAFYTACRNAEQWGTYRHTGTGNGGAGRRPADPPSRMRTAAEFGQKSETWVIHAPDADE